jgi:hypothetical protein
MRQLPCLNVIYRWFGDVFIVSDISTKFFHPIVVVSLQKQIVDSLHGMSHSGCWAVYV